MSHLAHIADRVLNRPLLILPEKLAIITEVLAGRIAIDAASADIGPRDSAAIAALEASLDRMKPEASRFVGSNWDKEEKNWTPYKRTEAGVAVITITGSLVNRGAWVGASSGLTSYEGIGYQIERAARDPKVNSILLDIESPGGEAVGCFEIADLIRKAGAEKPIHAVVNGMACSAAYSIASACKSIMSTPSGLSGSIGVVMLHADYSRAIDRAGITTTFIHAGAHKVDGNAYSPLSKEVRGDLQAEVDTFYDKFLETVAAGRGKRLSAKAARATEARTFIGQAAKDAGLVDEIGSFAERLDDLASLAKTGRAPSRSKAMSNLFSQEDLDRSRAAGKAEGLAEGRQAGHAEGKAAGLAEGEKAGKEAGVAEGRKAGAADERARIKSILGSEEAKGREASAQHLALASDMSAEEAIGMLATLPKGGSIGARSEAETIIQPGAFIDTGEGKTGASKGGHDDAERVPGQKGAVAWNDVADRLNAEHSRRAGAGRR